MRKFICSLVVVLGFCGAVNASDIRYKVIFRVDEQEVPVVDGKGQVVKNEDGSVKMRTETKELGPQFIVIHNAVFADTVYVIPEEQKKLWKVSAWNMSWADPNKKTDGAVIQLPTGWSLWTKVNRYGKEGTAARKADKNVRTYYSEKPAWLRVKVEQ